MLIKLFLFLISFVLNFVSSYFLASIFRSKLLKNTILYLILIFLSQVILTVEILSILNKANYTGILLVNIVFFAASSFIWYLKKMPSIDFSPVKTEFLKIKKALIKDKSLLFVACFFVFALMITFYLALAAPSNSWDALAYHLARVGFWVQNQTLAHYWVSDARQLLFPINSEIFMFWSMAFVKTDLLTHLCGFFSYTGVLFVLYSFLSFLNISTRRTLWTVFLLGSFPALLLEACSIQTNTMVAFFIFCAIYLFLYGIYKDSKKSVVFSALSFAVVLGLKYASFSFLPILFTAAMFLKLDLKKKLKAVGIFTLSCVPFFFLLSSYNYILNYFTFGAFTVNKAGRLKLATNFGLRATVANVIRYIYLFFDYTGFKSMVLFGGFFLGLLNVVFAILAITPQTGLAYQNLGGSNVQIHENLSMYGVLGFIVYLPLVIKYGLFRVFSAKHRTFLISLTGAIFIAYLIVLASTTGFTFWHNRYLTVGVIIGAPILCFSYYRKMNFFKLFCILIICFNFTVIPLFNASKPFFGITKLIHKEGFAQARKSIRLKDELYFDKNQEISYLMAEAKKIIPDNSKVGLILSPGDWYYPFFETNPTWKIKCVNIYELMKNNETDCDYLISSKDLYQLTDLFAGEEMEYKYTFKDKKLEQKKGSAPPYRLFLNKDQVPYDIDDKSVTPVYAANFLDYSLIKRSYALVRQIVIRVNSPDEMGTQITRKEKKNKFCIFKKIVKNR